MTDSRPPETQPPSYDELQQQNQALRRELDDLQTQQAFIWNLFAETSRRFQVYSASIKAAVSSLLNYDIFWDSANQHEFLETIDSSVNQVSEMTVLLTLAFRTQANSLELNQDSNLLQEILSASQAMAAKKLPGINLEVSYPPDGLPVRVDYEYLTKTLLLLYEVLFAYAPADALRVAASETESAWRVDITGPDLPILKTIEQMHYCKTQPESNDLLSPENILKLHIACEIIHLQQISLTVLDEPGRQPMLQLVIPTVQPYRSFPDLGAEYDCQ